MCLNEHILSCRVCERILNLYILSMVYSGLYCGRSQLRIALFTQSAIELHVTVLGWNKCWNVQLCLCITLLVLQTKDIDKLCVSELYFIHKRYEIQRRLYAFNVFFLLV